MGERFLILEETADALDVIDPELAVHFRTVNGLPKLGRDGIPTGSAPVQLEPAAAPQHEIRMDVGDDHIRADCSCGSWSHTVGWDEIDRMVGHVREHVGSARTTGGDALAAGPPAPVVTKQVG